jgi:serine-type D-Ala-D-Ala carboxypeptidase
MTSGSRSNSFTPPRSRQRFGAVYRVLQDAIAAHAFPGCAFGVLTKDAVVLQDAVGRFTYDDDAPAVTSATVFDVASVTKVMATTAAAMLLSQRKQLNIDSLLGDSLPGFIAGRESRDPAHRVTLRNLLAHNSGLPGYVEFFRTVSTPEALLRACFGLALESEPGARAEYSDPGFILLGKALEASTGERLDAWVRREVIAPLGLAATGFCPPPSSRYSIPPTEHTGWRNRCIQGEVQDENAWILQGVAGHAGLFSNVPDVLRFAGAVLQAQSGEETGPPAGNEANLPEPRLFDEATVAAFARRQGPQGSSRALGWDTPSEKSSSGRYFSPHSIGHLGYSGCSLWIDLDARVTIALLTNRTWPDRASQLIREVRPAFHDAVREAL